MDIFENKSDTRNILKASGRLDAGTSGVFEEKLMGIIEEGKEILVDFTELKYVSSSGLRVLLMAAKKLSASKRNLTIFGMQEHIKEVFDISGFTSLFNIVQANPYE